MFTNSFDDIESTVEHGIPVSRRIFSMSPCPLFFPTSQGGKIYLSQRCGTSILLLQSSLLNFHGSFSEHPGYKLGNQIWNKISDLGWSPDAVETCHDTFVHIIYHISQLYHTYHYFIIYLQSTVDLNVRYIGFNCTAIASSISSYRIDYGCISRQHLYGPALPVFLDMLIMQGQQIGLLAEFPGCSRMKIYCRSGEFLTCHDADRGHSIASNPSAKIPLQ